jgi:hypothetical protein
MSETVAQRVLERAAQMLGEPALASRLGISNITLRLMLSGAQPVPDSILLKAVDVVMDGVPDFTPPPPSEPAQTKKPKL